MWVWYWNGFDEGCGTKVRLTAEEDQEFFEGWGNECQWMVPGTVDPND